MLASCPSLRFSYRKMPVSCTEAECLVTELWPPRFLTMQWLCSQLCYVTAANQRTIVEIEPLATVGWKRGCQPFSCPCTLCGMHCRKRFCSTCLFQEFRPFVKSKPPLPTSWEPQYAPQVLHYGCIMPIPSLQLKKKKQSRAEKQRGYCYNAVFVLSVVTMQFLFVVSKAACRGILRSRPHVSM